MWSPRPSGPSSRASCSSTSVAAGLRCPASRLRRPRPRRSRPPPRDLCGPGGSAVRLAGLVRVGDVAEPAEQLAQRLDLRLVEDGRDPAVDVLDVLGGGLPQLLATGVGEDGVAHARVLLACPLPDEALLLEAIEEAGDPGGREPQPVGAVDAAHALLAGPGEQQQGPVVV